MSLYNHLVKANMIVDTFSMFYMGRLSHIDEEKRGLVKDIHKLVNIGVHLLDSKDGGVIVQRVVK